MPPLITSTPDISSLPADVLRYVEENPYLLTDILRDGFQSLNNDFTVVQCEDEVALYSLTAFDIAQVASDDFKPLAASKIGFRKAKMQNIDYDFQIPRSKVIEIMTTHVRKFVNAGSVQDALTNPVELLFLQEVLAAQGSFLRMNGAWKGDQDSTAGPGAANAVDGLLLKMAAGSAAGPGNDIPASHVVPPAAALDETNTYDHVQELCDKIVATKEDLLSLPLEARCSFATKQKYDRNRRALFPHSVGPQDSSSVVDDYDNIKFVVDPGLAGKDFISITPRSNLIFGTDADVTKNRITIIPDMKVWKVNVFVRAFFDYGYGNFIFHNAKY
jgi:hypothetical protein